MLDPDRSASSFVPAQDSSFAEEIRLLADDAKALAVAEVAFQKSRAAYLAGESRNIAILAVAGLIIAALACFAFVVGLVIALGDVIGPWWSMIVVTASLLLCASFSALSMRARLKRMRRVLSNNAAGKEAD